jgi:hypothetical protein
MTEADELRESVKKSVKNIVSEVVSDAVSRIAKASTKRVVKKLKEKLKEKAFHKLEESLKDIAEQGLEGQLDKGASRAARQLDKNIKQTTERVTKDSFERVDFVRGIEQGFEKGFRKCLSSLVRPVVITCVAVAAVAGGAIVWGNNPPETPFPPPESSPDLIITEVWHEWSEGGAVICYLITNQSEAETGESVTILFYGSRPVGEDVVGPMYPGQTLERNFFPYPLPETGFEIDVCADNNDWIDETDEENNCRWYEWGSPSPPSAEPDLVITKVWHDWSEGGAVICYLITNQSEAETGESVTVLLDGGKVIREDFIGPMVPGQTIERAFAPYPLPETGFEVELRADAGNRLDESNEENNSRWYGWAPPVSPPPEPTGCLDFELLKLGAEYKVGDAFADFETPVSVGTYSTNHFFTYTSDGTTTVVGEGFTGTSGQALYLNRATLYFNFEGPLSELTFNFGGWRPAEYSGDYLDYYYLVINEEVLDFSNFYDINGETIGGVDIAVNMGGGNMHDKDTGRVTISGDIKSFGVGGENLYIDHVCLIR